MTFFSVNPSKKRKIEKQLSKKNAPKTLFWLSRILSATMILAPCCFCAYAYLIDDGFVYRLDRYGTVGEKNTLLILTISGAIFSVFLILTAVFTTLTKAIANQNTLYRMGESLCFDGDILRYSYKNFMHATPSDMVVVKLRMDETMRVQCDSDLAELSFHGSISSVYYEDYQRGITSGEEKYVVRDFAIYDYFEPTLQKFLEQKGFLQNEEGERRSGQ